MQAPQNWVTENGHFKGKHKRAAHSGLLYKSRGSSDPDRPRWSNSGYVWNANQHNDDQWKRRFWDG